MKKVLFVVAMGFVLAPALVGSVFGQNVAATKIATPVTMDGLLSEPEWANAPTLSGFIQFEPEYGKPSPFVTVVRVLYDDQNLYLGVDCKDPEPEKITAKMTKRDSELDADDAVIILLDTFHDKSNAYLFSVNPLGTQQDGRVADNGRTVDYKWDQSWQSACSINTDGWSAEIAIPFKNISFNPGLTEWGFNVGRRIARNVELCFSSWPLTQPMRVAQFGLLTNLNLKDLVLKRYAFIPYVQTQFQQSAATEREVGADLRFRPVRNLGIEATINPDFATIEGDVEQVNLTRFELSYPEKRPFFLEGGENYSTRIKQFYSRRIGEIPWGVKVDGKINTWKLNGLVTRSDPATAGAAVTPGKEALYSVFRVNYELKNGSNIGVIGANRSYRGENSGSVGLVATLFFTDVLGMTSQFIKSHGPAKVGTWTYFIRPAFDSQFSHFHVRYSHYGEGVMENMNAIGFIRDDDRREFDTNIRHIFWINRHGIESITPSINYNQYWSQKGVLRSWEDSNSLTVKFRKKWEYQFKHVEDFRRYEKDFRNSYVSNQIEYDNKKGMVLSLQYAFGKNYDRDLEQFSGGVDAKLSEKWSLTYQFSKYWFRPARENDNSWIHYIRSSYYFTKDLYIKVFYQTKYRLFDGLSDPEFDLLRKTVQVVFVWRFLSPFGSLQLAYQEGTTRYTETEAKGRMLFTKLSWVF